MSMQAIQQLASPTSSKNPYASISLYIKSYYIQPREPSLCWNLYILSALFGVLLVVNMVIIAYSVFKSSESFWLFRLQQTKRGSYILPRFSTAWLVFILPPLIIVQLHIWSVIGSGPGTDSSDGRSIIAYTSVIFVIVWLSVWVTLWSLVVSACLLIPRSLSGTNQPSGIPPTETYTAKVQRALTSPLFINIHFLFLSISFVGITMTCGGLATYWKIKSVDYGNYIRDILDGMAEVWPGWENDPVALSAQTERVANVVLREVGSEVLSMRSAGRDALNWFKLTWVVCFGYTIYCAMVGLCVLLCHRYYLKKHLLDNMPDHQRTNFGAVKGTLTKHFLASVSITCLSFAFVGVCAYTGLSPALTTKTGMDASLLSGLYAFALFGTIATLLFSFNTVYKAKRGSIVPAPMPQMKMNTIGTRQTRSKIRSTIIGTRTRMEEERMRELSIHVDVLHLTVSDTETMPVEPKVLNMSSLRTMLQEAENEKGISVEDGDKKSSRSGSDTLCGIRIEPLNREQKV